MVPVLLTVLMRYVSRLPWVVWDVDVDMDVDVDVDDCNR